MKKVWSMFMLLAVCLVACTNIDDLEDDVDALKKRVTALETQVRDINSNTEALRELYNEGTFITNIEEKSDSYTLTLSNGKTVNLYMKNDNNLLCPIIGIDSEGYWTVLYNKNETPERLTVNGQPVKANGESGKTPTFNVDSEGYWQVSYDEGKKYEYIYKEGTNDKVSATGDGSAPTEDKNFKSVTVENNELVLVLAGEDAPTIRIPIISDFECSFAAEDLEQIQEFSAGETKEFTMTMRGVKNTMITAPEGWSAKFSKEAGKENVLIVTAPASSAKMMTRATADNSTDIAILATSGKYAMIAKIQVSIKNRTDYKADFDHGKDITIGGITINNQIYSDADIQILDATDADVALDTYFSATMSKPVILFLTGTAHNFTTTGVKSISNDVIIIGRYDDEQVTLRPINCWKSCKGKLLFKNIKIDLSDLNGGSNAGYFINNAGVISKGDFTDICIDNCLIANVLKPIYYDAAQKTYFGIDNISVQDTRIEVNAIKIALINIYKGFNLGDYKTFNFKNNIVYSQTPQEGVQILNWATGNIPLSDGVLSAEIINNTFVNMIGSNIFFRYQKGTSLTISKNIFDVSPEAEFGSYYYSFLESCTPQIDVTDNIVYGLTKNWNYYHTSSLVKEPTSGNNITKHATAPITQYDYVNGIFTLASDVAGYGATIE